MVVAGAGLAGLAAAAAVARAGRQVCVLEAADRPGGRVRTDAQDGLLLDKSGLPTAQPRLPRGATGAGPERIGPAPVRPRCRGTQRRAAARVDGSASPTIDTARHSPRPLGSWAEKLALAWWAAEVGFEPAARINHRNDEPLAAAVRRRGLGGRLGQAVLTPFLAGVLAEEPLSSSRRLGELLIRAFVRGTPALPAAGMQAVADQLAEHLPAGALRLNSPVLAVQPGTVHTEQGTVRPRAVIVACDPRTACDLLGRPEPTMHSLTTYYHACEHAPTASRLRHIDGDRNGPVINTAVVSNVAGTYADRGRSLMASTVLGVTRQRGGAGRPRARRANI